MIYEATISKVNTISSNDGAWFPKDVVQRYLDSPRGKARLADGLVLGTLTHKYRNGAEDVAGLGEDDRLLDEGVITHVVRDSWIDGDLWKARIEVFDDLSDYAELEKPKILQLLRLLKHNINLTCSIVTDADWDVNNKMVELYDLIGLDFTLNPAVAGSKIESSKIIS